MGWGVRKDKFVMSICENVLQLVGNVGLVFRREFTVGYLERIYIRVIDGEVAGEDVIIKGRQKGWLRLENLEVFV